MRARILTPLVLAAIAAALAAYILLVERDHATTDEARAARTRVFPALARADVTAIEIDRGGKGRVRLARAAVAGGDATWTVGADAQPVAAGAVADLLDAIDGLEIDRAAATPPEVAGLAPPAVQLAIVTAAGRSLLDLGGLDASGRGVFARRAGDARTLVVGRRVRDLADRDAGAFRDRRLFAPGVAEAATVLAFQPAGGPHHTLRKHAGVWLDEDGFFAARTAIGEALRALAALEASGFPEAAPARPATPPRETLELTAGGRARLEIWAEGCEPAANGALELAALTPTPDGSESTAPRTAPVAAPGAGPRTQWLCLDPGVGARLGRLVESADRRERHLLIVDAAAADGVILAEGERRLHLRREATAGWRIVEPAVSYAADPGVVAAWFERLAAVEIGAAAAPSVGASRPGRRLVIEGATRAEVTVEPPRAGFASVARLGEAGPARVLAQVFAELDPDPLRFRQRTVLTLPRFDVTRIDIQQSSGTRLTLVADPRGGAAVGWLATDAAHAGRRADAASVDRLLNALAELRADRFSPEHLRFIPDTTIDLDLRAGSLPHQHLELTAQCTARLADSPVFTLAPETCATLRSRIPLDP